jgi:hypothetical protein
VPRIDKCRARRRRLLPGFPSIIDEETSHGRRFRFLTARYAPFQRRKKTSPRGHVQIQKSAWEMRERFGGITSGKRSSLSLSLSRRGDRRNLDEGRRKAKSQIRAPMDQVNQIARARNAWLADANGGVLGGLLLTYRIVRNERSRLPRGSRYAAMARKACIKDRSWALYWPIYMTVELITASQL